MVQLNILRDLTTATADKLDVNTIFKMVVEGMHRGIGLERVCIAFKQGHRISAKYILGTGTESWRESFDFDVGPFDDSLFCDIIDNGGSYWYQQEEIEKNPRLHPEDVSSIIGHYPCFVHVLEVDGRKAALFYADRWNMGGDLSPEQYESFKHFSTQAQVSLTLLSAGR